MGKEAMQIHRFFSIFFPRSLLIWSVVRRGQKERKSEKNREEQLTCRGYQKMEARGKAKHLNGEGKKVIEVLQI